MAIQNHQTDHGVVTLRSGLLQAVGVPHAFSTRIGGVSRGAFAGLNLGPHNVTDQPQDDPANRQENERRLMRAIGQEKRQLAKVKQIHGDRIVIAKDSLSPDEQADAIVTDSPRWMVSVRIADCVPILIASRDGRCVAAVHAGWRGVVANIVGKTVLRMKEVFGISPDELLAAIGPCIGPKAFEVGPDVVQAFHDARLASHVTLKNSQTEAEKEGGGYVNLTSAVAEQLQFSGLHDSTIDRADSCTVERSDLFFSHRRDLGITGRMAALIGVKQPAQ